MPTNPSHETFSAQSAIRVRTQVVDVCPHDTVPPNPACAPKPLSDVTIVVLRADDMAARAVSDLAGLALFTLPPGDYTVKAEPVPTLRITPQPHHVTTRAGQTTTIELDYSTGGQ